MPSRSYTQADIIKALKGAGLCTADTAYFSTSLGMLGFAENVNNADELNALFYQSIFEVLGEQGNLLVPTYSYTFGGSTLENPNVYYPKNTPAEVGPFPNYVLKQDKVIRSRDPMMSMAGAGPNIESLFNSLPNTSYGKDSVYERLLSRQTKCVSIGLGTNWTPFIHHADWLNKVPFRYDKLFYGGIQEDNGNIEYQYWLYSAPARIDESFADAHILGKLALDAGIWKHHPLGRAGVYVCDYREYFEFTLSLMKTNKWLMAKGPKCDVVAKDQEKLARPLRKPEQAIDRSTENKALFEHLRACERKTVSPEITYFLECLQQHYPIEIHHTQSGQNAYDWIVPERIETQNGEVLSSMSTLSTGRWHINKQHDKTVVLCCYIDESQDLSGLYFTLALMQQLEILNTAYNFCCLMTSGTAGFAYEMTQLDEASIVACLHIVENHSDNALKDAITLVKDTRRKDNFFSETILNTVAELTCEDRHCNFDPLKAGHNPIAKRTLNDLAFENPTLLITADSLEGHKGVIASLAKTWVKAPSS